MVDARDEETLRVVGAFNDAFGRHDVDAMMALMTADCVFENTYPPPDGVRFKGQAAVRGFWEEFFRSNPNANFVTEELFAAGDRAVMRWIYRWANGDLPTPGYVRGVDIFRVVSGKVAEKLSYVKG